MELTILDTHKKIQISDRIFNVRLNHSLVHQVIKSFLSNLRTGTKSQKNRSQVSGSNKKPWKQKGTGHARAGSVKSPIWRSGGMAFATNFRSYKKKINKKMYKKAMRCIFSELIRENRLVIVENLFLDRIKTKLFKKMIDDICRNRDKILIITKKINQFLILSSRNLHKINICEVSEINPVNLIKNRTIISTVEAIKKVEESL
ncbi:50S ribosomal protein L4 [Candidatus Riesia pediculicola]|uniref:Large ribosomal subunit protein uL4 n=1 Tax=Riesia pediculicola (strain USDA) TaxID=515618 RepID=D4G8N3_RIEPU|nr:50S ribosomal protein L4 [Candidatus Riesia pediculicola]ADD79555.1 ribosomal protein L4/L1 family [Candidatus Riesia pediculicola USDA]ARC53911.1 50S ribosomal protein L4 [Candidatus Riesia pediculicola]QOJ86541.1 50S ribosomal protein L4 [Candidatus Riesia pediculicola]